MTRSWFKYKRDEMGCQGGGVFSLENPADAGFSSFGSLLILGLLAGEAADRATEEAGAGAGRIDVARGEGEVGGVASRERSRRPIVPVVACAPQRPRVDEPAAHEV